MTGVCIDGRPIEAKQRYEVATVEFLAKAGDAYTQFAAADSTELLDVTFAKALETAFAKAELVGSPPLGALVANSGPKYECANLSTQGVTWPTIELKSLGAITAAHQHDSL